MVPQTIKNCSVCTDKESIENEIFICIGCNVNVHRLCYGIQSEYDENWKCSLCMKGIRRSVPCQLCLQPGGALKPIVGGLQYVHVVCGLFTEGVIFENADLMEPISISNVSNNKRNKMCAFCKTCRGFSSLCSNYKCKNRLHVTCAQKANCLKEQVNRDESIKFRAFCAEHKPVATDRKISSGSVRRVSLLNAKKIDEKNKENRSRLNAQWILGHTKKNSIGAQNPNKTNEKNSAAKSTVYQSQNVANDRKLSSFGVDDELPVRNKAQKKSFKECLTVDNQNQADDVELSPIKVAVDSSAQESPKETSHAHDFVISSENGKAKRKRTATENADHTRKQRKTNKNHSLETISNEVLLTEFSPSDSRSSINAEGKF